MSSIVYGVEQSLYGHRYRWIFDEQTLFNKGIPLPSKQQDICEDISFPIGGSNSSATYIVPLENDEQVRDFLLAPYETDYDDPMLVDIAEGLCTIACDENSITSRYVQKFKIPQNELTKENNLYAEANAMILALQTWQYDEDIDRESPFYGFSRELRFSELKRIYDEAFLELSENIQQQEERE